MIFLALLLGVLLRVLAINSNYYFNGELGRELLYVRELINSRTFPLIGLTTSHEWLNYGPAYYWILIPIFKFVSQSPFILFWLALVVSVIGAAVTYFVFSKIEGKRFAQILSFYVATSPLWIWITRLSKLHVFFFILIPLVIYFLYKLWKGNKNFLVWLGVSYGFLFSFHFSQIPLFLVILFEFYLKRKILRLKDYLVFAVGLIIPNITIFIYDASSKFLMLKNLILWLPYRILGFFGVHLIVKPDVPVSGTTLDAFNEFLGRNLFWDSRFWILGSIVFLIMFVSFAWDNRKKIDKDFFSFYLVSSTIIQSIALVLHKNPPIHYFMPIYLNFGLFFAYFVNKYWDKKSVKFLTVFIFILIGVIDVLMVKAEHARDQDFVPITSQYKAINNIIEDANGKAFKITRIGPYDCFPDEYKQNYEYLIYEKGGNLDPNSNLMYTIFDQGGFIHVFKNL